MADPFASLLVVALEQAVAAPFCTARLADAGARVIKVERPEGDFARGYDRLAAGQSSYFVWLNRGKQSVALDLKVPENLHLLRAMLARADVLVQNLAPGALERMGFDAKELGRLNPRLIQCNISGFGRSGPFRNKKAYDLLVQAESGLASVTGTPDGPGRVGVSVVDIATGMYAYAAILEALLRREAGRKGEIIDVAMFDAMADWMAAPLLQAEGSGRNPPRLGLHHPSIAPYGSYSCRGGVQVLIAIQNEREWSAFCAGVLGDEAVANDARFDNASARVANRADLDAIIEARFAAFDRPALVSLLEAVGIAYAGVNTVLDLARHPHLRRLPVATAMGTVEVPAPPAMRREGANRLSPVPALDADGDTIRREFAGEGGA